MPVITASPECLLNGSVITVEFGSITRCLECGCVCNAVETEEGELEEELCDTEKGREGSKGSSHSTHYNCKN